MKNPNIDFYSESYSGDIDIPASIVYEGVEYRVEVIAARAFSYCEELTSVTIPYGVYSIGHEAFLGCSGLTSLTIPETVSYIDYQAFEGCSSLTSINLPDKIEIIYDAIFYGCTKLSSVTIPNNVVQINSRAFWGCSSLTSINIPSSVKIIGSDAFFGCSGLNSIFIPNSVTSIESTAFEFCIGLKDFYCRAENVPSTDNNAFYETLCELATLHVPAGSVNAYKKTYPWSLFGTIVALTDDDPKPTGVYSLKVDNNITPEATFSLDGRRLSNPQRGLNIIRMSDGSTKKVMIK